MGRDIAAFNDDPHTTFEMVKQAYKKAIELAAST